MLGKQKSYTGGVPPLPTARDLVMRAYLETEKQGEAAFLGRFKLMMRSNPQCHDPVFEHYALAILRGVQRTKSAHQNNQTRKKKVQEKSDEYLKLMLLFTVMPNGKRMGECTGSDMAKFGKGYERIAERVGPDRKVGDVLDEDGVRALMKMPK